ncbi:MAG: hypothetical protein ACLQT5_04840 [Steroidobacteraceae bacterium]
MDPSRRLMIAAAALGLASARTGATAADSPEIDDVRRYGIVPNEPNAAHANTAALRQLCSPEISPHGFAGLLQFPNATGSDTYYFDDIITFRDGISLDLQNCTLNFTKIGADPHAVNAGFIYAVRNFTIENGVIDVHYASAGAGQGSAIAIGSRSAAGFKYFPNHFDKLLPRPQGNICIRNMRLTSDNPNAQLLLALGGLRNVCLENVVLDGQGLANGIYYEFGWETNESNPTQRQTSHAHNLRLVNIAANNLKRNGDTAAIVIYGAYNVLLDGISVNGAYAAVSFGTGESLFYRPAIGIDDIGAKRNIQIRNLVAQDLTGTAVVFTGANLSSGGYLKGLGLGPAAQTDLLDCSIDGFAIDSAAGYGIRSSAGRLLVRNGRISNCERGIVTTDECTWFSVSDVAIVNNAGIGIQIGQAVDIYDPPREKMGAIRNCFIAGNSTATPGANAGVNLSRCRSVLIENNRFGYERGHDGRDETTQGSAVVAGADGTFGIRCVGNYVAATAGAAPAYVLSASGAHGRGCTIEHAGGVTTRQGLWGDGLHQLEMLAFNAAITPNCQYSNEFVITAADAREFAIDSPLNPAHGQRITVTIRNESNGAAGSCTWQPVFKMSAWQNPRSGHNRSIEFLYDGKNWLEIARTAQDVPN